MLKSIVSSFFALLAAVCVFPTLAADTSGTGILVQALLKTGGSKVGELGRENETHVEILDINTGQATTFPKADVIRLNKELSDDFAAQTIGLASIISWKTSRLIPAEKPQGAIANIDAATLYVSLGSRNGVDRGDKLRVFRGETEIKDPATGEVLGKQRRKISELEVFESQEKFCKAKQLGDLEIPLAVGDLVEPASFSNAIAIFPPLTSSNSVTEAGVRIAEDLTTALVKRGIQVVERKLLTTALAELAIEQTALFDEASAAKVGKHAGAFGVLTGTLTSDGKTVRANLRLIEVETGRIRFTVSSRVKEDIGKLIDVAGPGTATRPEIASSTVPSRLPAVKSGVGFIVLGHWTLDETLANSALGGKTGEAMGKISWDEGKIGKCLSLRRTLPDGSGPYVVLSDDPRFDLGNKDFCVALWIRPKPGARRWPLLSKGKWGEFGWVFEVLPGGKIWFECRVGKEKDKYYPVSSGDNAVEFDKWQHVAVIVTRESRGGKTQIFVNGEKVAEGVTPDGDIGNKRFDLELGRINTEPFHGDLEDVYLIEGRVAKSVIVELMNAAKLDR